jgi:hypothetical protein
MSMEPHPIKVTSLADGIISSNKQAIENAKTGKVTAVAAVMYLIKNDELTLHNANSKKKRETNGHRTKKTIRVLLDTGSSGDLLFVEKGSSECIPIVRRAIPESWGTSNGTFKTTKVGNIEISFVDYFAAKGFI